jgi:hypothetical protein
MPVVQSVYKLGTQRRRAGVAGATELLVCNRPLVRGKGDVQETGQEADIQAMILLLIAIAFLAVMLVTAPGHNRKM